MMHIVQLTIILLAVIFLLLPSALSLIHLTTKLSNCVMIHLFLFFHLFTSCAPSHDPQSVSFSIAAQRLTYNACRTFWNYLYKDSTECLIANTCSPTSIYSQEFRL